MKKCLVLGNASDRLEEKEFIKNWKDEIWICNYAYKEYLEFPRIDVVGTVHSFVVTDALQFKKENNLNFRILSSNRYNSETEEFKNYLGFSTGWELVNQAILEGFEEIYICGFAVINNCDEDIYFPKGIKPYCGNFINQFYFIKEKYPNSNIIFVK